MEVLMRVDLPDNAELEKLYSEYLSSKAALQSYLHQERIVAHTVGSQERRAQIARKVNSRDCEAAAKSN